MYRLYLAGLLCSHIAFAAYDWRFADPNSQLIAGCSVTPTPSNPVAYFFLSRWAPLNRLPGSFQSLTPKIHTVSYSAVSRRLEVVALSGAFDFAAIRSAAGAAGMTSTFYHSVEVLATPNSNRDSIALIDSGTIVFGGPVALTAALDRWIAGSTLSLSNPLIQQSQSFTPGWDLFAIASGSESQSLFNAAAVSKYLNTKATGLGTQLAVNLGFTFRARTQSNFRVEVKITEPDAPTAQSAAASLATVPAQIKATGTGVADLLQAVGSYTSVFAVGPVIELAMDPNVYNLTTVVVPSNAGTVTPATTGVVFAANSTVTLTATPGTCYGAASWSANAPSGLVAMTGPQTVTATFSNTSAANYASNVTVIQGAFRLNHISNRYQQALSVINSGTALFNVSLVFDGLGSGEALYNPDGTTTCGLAGSPYRNIASLPFGTTPLVVEFSVTNPAAPIQYTPRVLSGAGSR
jgi:hypothetical protein